MRRLALLAALALSGPASARDFAPRDDLEIVALDLATGAVKWVHKGAPLGHAHFELYPRLLAVYPHYDLQDRSRPMLLDPATGAAASDTRDPKRLIAASSAQWIRGPVTLARGWTAKFDAGNTRTIEWKDPGTGKIVWTIDPGVYAERVLAYKDLALVGWGYLTDEAILAAYRPGAKQPAWRIDFNVLLGKPKAKKALDRLGRVQPQVIGDVLYLQTGQHVFAIAPATGKILWRLDAANEIGVPYEPDLYGGALDMSVFARDQDTLVVMFEKRVFALDARTGRVRWHVAPDTFPHAAFPLAHGGVVYLSSGPRRGKAIRVDP
jgi:outer membrane protein assembly factor BamB